MSKSVIALSTCAPSINIERANQQLQRLRKLVVQAEHSHNEARMRSWLIKTNAEPSNLGSPDIGLAKLVTEPMKNHLV